MAAERKAPTLADYVVTTFSPVLIMVLIGSLVFFLLEILYVGDYPERMQWTLFFFVFGCVLIGRMVLLTEVAGRSGLYTLILGFLTWLAVTKFVDFPAGSPMKSWSGAINLGLIVLIWWSAQKLTRDCTHVEDSEEASGRGSLDAAGLDAPDAVQKAEPVATTKEKKGKKQESALSAWLNRFSSYWQRRQKQPRTPGVWVIYFSLAALPLFGLGQSLIAATDGGRRRYVFWLMALYVGSGLGLLLTTTFLGLRRYLRQRGLQMPAAMTGVWLSSGAVLIVLLLTIGAFLPRPQAEYSVAKTFFAGSENHDASQYAMHKGEGGKGGEKSASGQPKKGEKDTGEGGGSSQQEGGNAQGQSKDQGGKGSGDKDGGKGNQGKGNQGKGEQDGKGDKSKEQGEAGQQGSSSSSPPEPTGNFLEALGPVGTVLKWIVFGILGLFVGFIVLRAILQFFANFTGWAASLLGFLNNLWASLFGWLEPNREEVASEEQPIGPPEPPPFHVFENPFTSGRARRMAPAELVRYTFEALEAWAHAQGLDRRPEETPFEFAARLGEERPALEADVQRLANLYARAAYAGQKLPASAVAPLQELWQQLEATERRPISV